MTLTAQQKYRQSEKGKLKDRRYKQSAKGKKAGLKYYYSVKGRKIFKEYREAHLESLREYQRNYPHTLNGKINREKYTQSEKGKMCDKRHKAKRKRNLGFIPLMNNPFPQDVPIDYHHINSIFVIPVPRQTHKSMLGKNHRVKVNNWIEEIIGDIGVC